MAQGPGLLLDLGGVVHRSAFELLDTDHPALRDVLTWLGPFGSERDELWHAMQRREIGERGYWRRRVDEIGRALGHEGWTLAELADLTTGAVDESQLVRPEACRLLSAAR